jgi:hypothetical protein
MHKPPKERGKKPLGIRKKEKGKTTGKSRKGRKPRGS